MTDGIRKALDALMGSNRNGDKPTAQKHFSDPDICKYYLAGLCPHELFTNTVFSCKKVVIQAENGFRRLQEHPFYPIKARL